MKKLTQSRKARYLSLAAFMLLLCHHFILRPVFLNWGSTEEIRRMSLSGDVFTDGSKHSRAVLIEATPEELWPWLVQVGQDRAGFYSYEWLENIFFADMNNVYELKPEFQFARQAGDTVWLASKEHYNGLGHQIVAETTPLRSLVMVDSKDYLRLMKGEKAFGSWAFYLYPETATRTWLIARSSEGHRPFHSRVLRYFTFEVPHFIMERKMLKSMKTLAENRE